MRHRTLLTMVFLTAAAALLLWLAPAEQTLGQWVKLIYLHSALSYAGLYVIYGAGILAAAYLLTGVQPLMQWSRQLLPPALMALLISLLLSLVAMEAAWGGLFLREPRTIAAMIIIGLGLGKEILTSSGSLRLAGAANASFAILVLIIRLNLTYVMHPQSPIRSSESLAIRFFPALLLIICVAAILEYARWKLHKGSSD